MAHESGEVLAYVIGQHQDSVFLKLKALLELFGVGHFSPTAGADMSATSVKSSYL
ncbi:MAG: hypothetical protein KC505_00890 [Myxococcales bacterium]|nr:hypothetical protein [Myxococcales bacterium]USN51969.1 MAG: hypothetical protein H6731_08490 [Myxococcales bacterium]